MAVLDYFFSGPFSLGCLYKCLNFELQYSNQPLRDDYVNSNSDEYITYDKSHKTRIQALVGSPSSSNKIPVPLQRLQAQIMPHILNLERNPCV